jgi:hypothetical protein
VIAKLGNLAMARQIGVKYGRQNLVKAVQHAGMGKEFTKSGVVGLHQRLNAFAPVAGFF